MKMDNDDVCYNYGETGAFCYLSVVYTMSWVYLHLLPHSGVRTTSQHIPSKFNI